MVVRNYWVKVSFENMVILKIKAFGGQTSTSQIKCKLRWSVSGVTKPVLTAVANNTQNIYDDTNEGLKWIRVKRQASTCR
ncbi:jg23595, partial [Pararge aegeria aegeria]